MTYSPSRSCASEADGPLPGSLGLSRGLVSHPSPGRRRRSWVPPADGISRARLEADHSSEAGSVRGLGELSLRPSQVMQDGLVCTKLSSPGITGGASGAL